jgi:hypothetical protein
MKLVRTLKVKLEEEEKNAIEKVLDVLATIWEQSENYEMDELWKRYGSNEDGWTGIEDTLKHLLNESK